MDRIHDEAGLYDHAWAVPEPDIPPNDWDPVEELAQMLSTTAGAPPAPTPLNIPAPAGAAVDGSVRNRISSTEVGASRTSRC
ncbi:hypothetical protein O1M54_27335 [Streptomyces diastatochromogenes]|nr:hypothetical protein [Streptomyces diastatochromogenes]